MDLYDKVKLKEVAEMLFEFIWIWIFYFFMYAKKIIRNERLPLYVSLGILNNDYAKFIKKFIWTALKKTGSKFKLKQIKARIHENVLFKLI